MVILRLLVAGYALRPILAVACVTVLLCSSAVDAWAQNDAVERGALPQPIVHNAPTLRFEHLGLEDGLAQASVFDIMQDSRGFLWFGTEAGLHRFDGYDLKIFAPVPFDTTTLSDGYVTSVVERRKGGLWVATARGGLNRLDPATGHVTAYRHDPADTTSLAADGVWSVLETSNGDVWVATGSDGLDVMRAGDDGRFTHFRHDPDDPSTLTSDYVNYVTQDQAGNIWAGTSNGVSRIDPLSGTVTRFLHNPGNDSANKERLSVFKPYHPPTAPGIVWLPTDNGLVRLHYETGEYERFLVDPNDHVNQRNRLDAIVPDPEDAGILWAVGNGTGLVRFDTRTETFTTYRHNPRDPQSLSDNAVLSLFADGSGTMWLGTLSEGLSAFNPGAVNFVHLRHDPDDPQSLAPGAVFGLYEDRDGSLWAGTNAAHGINFLTRIDRTGRVTRYRHNPGDPNSMVPSVPSDFAEDSEGNLWIGYSLSGGLNRVARADGRVKSFKHGRDTERSAERNTISFVVPTSEDPDVLWVGSFGGLDRFDTRTGSFTRVALDIEGMAEDPSLLSLHEDEEGVVWLGTQNSGLVRLEDGQARVAAAYDVRDTTSISDNNIYVIVGRNSEPGVLWLATLNGLNRFDTRTGTAKNYLMEDGLPNNVIYGILEDESGTLWMSTNGGISNFDPETNTFRNYGLDDGLMALEYDRLGFARGAGGVLYFGSVEGVTAFSPENLSTNTIAPSVALTDFKLFNESVAIGPGSLLERSLDETEQITLAHDQNEVTFDFVALHFENPEKNQYAYRLEGYDDAWIQAGTQRTATYTNLAPGTYTFRVKAANADGVWNEDGASIGLRVLPPWWRTLWAYAGFAALIGGVVVGGDRLQRKRHARKEAERTQIREAKLRAEAQQRRREDAERMSEIGKAITSTLSIREVIDTVYEHVNVLMDAAVFGIGIYNPGRERLDFPAMKERGETLPRFSNDLADDSRPAVWCFKHREAFIVGDFANEYQRYLPARKVPLQGEAVSSIVYLPLVHQDKAVGVITTQSFQKNAYSDYHVSVLRTLATYAAIALDNAESYRQLGAAMEDLRTTQERLVQQEKLASLGALTAGIAHEIKNPLNFITNFATLSRELVDELDDVTDPEAVRAILSDLKRSTEKVEEHSHRADSIVRSMMQHARGGSGKREQVNLNTLVDEHADLAYHGKRAQEQGFNVDFRKDLDESVGHVQVAAQEFGRVVLNLVGNAFDAVREKMGESGDDAYQPSVHISTHRIDGHVEVRVSDNGPGIPADVRDRIFEPFFTTKPTGSGTGLGLSLAHEIVALGHGGTLTVESEEGNGATFIITLPDASNGAALGQRQA